MEDHELLQQVIDGDKPALRRFIVEYGPVVYEAVSSVFAGEIVNPEVRADAFLETMTTLLGGERHLLRTFQGKATVRTWMFVLARRMALRALRRRRTEYVCLDKFETGEKVIANLFTPAPSLEPEDETLQFELAGALEKLDKQERQIVDWFYRRKRNYKQIVQGLSIDAQQVGQALMTAKAKLREALNLEE